MFLERMAPRSAAATQNQALNAIVFFYRDVLGEPLGDLGKWARAKRPKRLWFWVWPAGNESRDPRSGVVRRHHIHRHTLGKALRVACVKCGIHKRVTAHTLRHSFATNLLAAGASITQVQELMGHSSVETTQVYTHCIPQFARSIVSPMDAEPGNVVAFPEVENGTDRSYGTYGGGR